MNFRRSMITIRSFFNRIPPGEKVNILYQYIDREASSLNKGTSAPIFAVQGVNDPLYVGLLSVISIDVRRRVESAGRLVITRSLEAYIGVGFKGYVLRSGLLNWLISSQISRMHQGSVGAVGYRSKSFKYPFSDVLDGIRAYKLWRSLKKSDDISKLMIRDILVGDLLIDTYLRFRPSPFFLLKDRFVLTLLWQTHRDIRRAYDFFSGCKPSFYLSSQATYVQHGVPVRVALQLGVPVYIVTGGLVFGKRLSVGDYFHTPDASTYCTQFEEFNDKSVKLELAKEQLSFRLSGGTDVATAYMKKSAYMTSDEKVPNVKGAVVIFLHDFFDSPHVYHDFIFTEFWSWVCFTIDTFIASDISFWVKTHPNQALLGDSAVKQLLQKYPQLKMISSGITNSQLVESGIICGITAYGTVAHELAFMGVPSICCAKHPHHSFDFCRTASNVDEYKSFLQTPNVQPLSKKDMRAQALAFYYMHNINCGEDILALRRQFNVFFDQVHSGDDANTVEELAKFRELPAYNSFIEELLRARYTDSKK